MTTQPEAKLEADLIQKLIDNEYELGNYLTFNLNETDLNLIRNKISSIRQNILIQFL